MITHARALDPPWWSSSVACGIGLASSVGLRPAELYRLRCHDVDLPNSRLAVLNSKGGRSRLLPVHPSTTQAVAAHLEIRHASPATADTLLIAPNGTAVTSPILSKTFAALTVATGIIFDPQRRRPRLGDLRHSFVVATVTDWYRNGVDVRRELPVLSAYLGHVSPANTYWYYSDSWVIPMSAPAPA